MWIPEARKLFQIIRDSAQHETLNFREVFQNLILFSEVNFPKT